MKVVWLNEHILYWNGGIRYIYEVTKRLAKDNQVQLYVTQASNSNRELFSKANIGLIAYSNLVAANNLRYWIFYPYYLRKHAKLLQRHLKEYDAVISTSPTTDILAMLTSIKPIIVCFEPNPWLHNKEFIKGLPLLKKILVTLGKPFIRPMELRAYRNAKAIICHSKFVQSEIRHIYNVDSIVVSPGVDTKFFKRVENSTLHNTYKNYDVLLHLPGYLSKMKGTKYAIEAMQYIVKEIPDAMLLITVTRTDDTKPIDELRKLSVELKVDKHVEFIFNVLDADMPALYSLAKVILQPSLDENAHYPAIEGGCCECPTIGFQGIYDNEDIIEGTTGYIVDKYDSKMMAEAAIDIIRDNSLQGYLGRHAKQFMINKFSWSKCISKYKELINDTSMRT